MWSLENKYRRQGLRRLAGVDEVGRGCLSGPVLAAAFVASPNVEPPPVRDSKRLTPTRRGRLYPLLLGAALDYAVGLAGPREVEELNVLGATRLAMARALRALRVEPELVLIDGLELPSLSLPQRKVVRGDATVGSIAAASIIAKVTRDALMVALHRAFPAYGFDSNKGYGTPQHLRALRRFGPCPLHRRTFSGVRQPELVI